MSLQTPNASLDRRGCGRVPHRGEVLVKGESSTFGRGVTCDFNESGARLVVNEKVKPGHDLVVPPEEAEVLLAHPLHVARPARFRELKGLKCDLPESRELRRIA